MNLDGGVIIMDREQLAWTAGIIDGEGYTCVQTQRHMLKHGETREYYSLKVSVRQADDNNVPEMLSRLSKLFAVIEPKINGPYLTGGHKINYYDWSAQNHEKAQFVIAQVWPWLSEPKKRQATEAFNKYYKLRAERREQAEVNGWKTYTKLPARRKKNGGSSSRRINRRT